MTGIDGVMNIAERLREKAGADIGIPPRSRANQWLRLECPFCGGDRAAINYDTGWFKCYRCHRDISARAIGEPDAWPIYRFQPQIQQAVKKVKRAFGRWIEKDDAIPVANWLVWNYAFGRESKNDGGMLENWEADYDGEPRRVDGKVQCALDRDLMNWADHEKRWKVKTHAAGDMINDDDSDQIPIPDDGGLGYRLRARRARASMDTGGACFIKPNLDGPFNLGDLKRCELMRNGCGPEPGHCIFCDGAIGDTSRKRWERYTDDLLARAA